MSVVYVTNRSSDRLAVMYAYKELEFPVGKSVEIPLEAAQYIFGYGKDDKESCLAHLGWIRLHSELEQGMEKLSKFHIQTEAPEQNRSLPSAVGVVPLRLEKAAGGKVTQRAA